MAEEKRGMSESLLVIRMLGVCQDTKSVLRNCEKCGIEFSPVKRQRFCSNACKQAAYRDSPKYQERVRQRKAATLRRKMARRPYKYMSFDGRTEGPSKGRAKQRVRLQKDRGDLVFGAPRCTSSRAAVAVAGQPGKENQDGLRNEI